METKITVELVYPWPVPTITVNAIMSQDAFGDFGDVLRLLATWTDQDPNVTGSVKVEDLDAPEE